MKPWTAEHGHLHIALGSKFKSGVHRLVLLAFVGPAPPGEEGRHLNGNPQDNRLVNLAWGTKKQNAADRHVYGNPPTGENAPSSKLTSAKVLELRERHAAGEAIPRLAKEFGVEYTTAYFAVVGHTWRHVPFPAQYRRIDVRGSRSGMAKLDEGKVAEIKRRLAGERRADIAAGFGVSKSTIDFIAQGRIWRHVICTDS